MLKIRIKGKILNVNKYLLSSKRTISLCYSDGFSGKGITRRGKTLANGKQKTKEKKNKK